jgi:hypothetical protein
VNVGGEIVGGEEERNKEGKMEEIERGMGKEDIGVAKRS